MSRAFYFIAGLIALAFGALGALLPLLPTTPFVLLAAFCFAKSSPRVHRWLLAHGYFGPLVRNWQASGAIARHHKIAAALTMALAFAISLMAGVGLFILGIQAIVLLAVGAFVVTRPDPETISDPARLDWGRDL